MIIETKDSKKLKMILNLIINYTAYAFLSFPVIGVAAALMFILITISSGEASFEFLKYFSFLNGKFANDSFILTKGDIMQIYGVIAFVLIIIFEISKKIYKKTNKKEIIITFKKKLLYSFSLITFVYAVLFISIPYSNISENINIALVYIGAIIFYAISIFSLFLYLAISSIKTFISKINFKAINDTININTRK